jgi:hypothetical protein
MVMRVVSLLRISTSILLVSLAATAQSQAVTPIFPSDHIPYSGCYAPRCFEQVLALDNGTAISATQPLITVSIRGPTGWMQQQSILNPDIKPPRDYVEGERRTWPPFATAIGLSGDELLVAGSSSKYNFKDVVYVFSRANAAWTHTQTLVLRRPAEFEQTIVSHIAVDRGIALVTGTRYDDQDPAATFTQVDFYVRLGPGKWQRRGSFKPPAGSSDEFGASMDLSGSVAIFGDPAAGGSGRAYLFEYTSNIGWILRRRFAAASPAAGSRFGAHVAISGGSVAIAAPNQATNNWYQQGAIHLFSRNAATWQPAGIVFEPGIDATPDPFDVRTFGSSVSINGERVVVGTEGGYFAGLQPHAYLLEPYPTWRVAGELVNFEAPYPGRVFVSGSTAVVMGAAEWGDTSGYVFELPLIGQLP